MSIATTVATRLLCTLCILPTHLVEVLLALPRDPLPRVLLHPLHVHLQRRLHQLRVVLLRLALALLLWRQAKGQE